MWKETTECFEKAELKMYNMASNQQVITSLFYTKEEKSTQTEPQCLTPKYCLSGCCIKTGDSMWNIKHYI